MRSTRATVAGGVTARARSSRLRRTDGGGLLWSAATAAVSSVAAALVLATTTSTVTTTATVSALFLDSIGTTRGKITRDSRHHRRPHHHQLGVAPTNKDRFWSGVPGTICFSKGSGDDEDSSNSNVAVRNDEKTTAGEGNKNNDGGDDSGGYEVKTWNPLRLLVLRLGLTEPMGTSPLNYGKYDGGTFSCAYCGNVLFDASSKYDSGSGWPSFWRSQREDSIRYRMEFDGRLECRCGKCSSHLGHVFLDGPRPSEVPPELLEASPSTDPRGRAENSYLPRFCVNGASLRYEKGTVQEEK